MISRIFFYYALTIAAITFILTNFIYPDDFIASISREWDLHVENWAVFIFYSLNLINLIPALIITIANIIKDIREYKRNKV